MKIILAGQAGQGIQTIGKILALAGFYQGWNTSYLPSFGVEQRIGASLAFINLDQAIPFFDVADLVVVTTIPAWQQIKDKVGSQTKILYDPKNIDKEIIGANHQLLIPFETTGTIGSGKKPINIIILKRLLDYLPELKISHLKKALIEELAEKIKLDLQLAKEINLLF